MVRALALLVPAVAAHKYCPSASDLVVAYTVGEAPELRNQGWRINAGGGVATKAAFNLNNGSVEFDVNFNKVQLGVNANVYGIAASGFGSAGFTQKHYCDGAESGQPWCLETDWIETNGNCGGASTLHSVRGTGDGACNDWGCRASYRYGSSSFHVKVSYDADGHWHIYRDGQHVTGFKPSPSSEWGHIKAAHEATGVVIYSSQWTGWTPVEDCGSGGSLDASHFEVSNLVIHGKVVAGPHPTSCTTEALLV